MQVKGLSAQKIVHECTFFCALGGQGDRAQKSDIRDRRSEVIGQMS
jgi:hypothetical protein